MRRAIALLSFWALALPSLLGAQGIKATVDRAEVSLEDQIVLTITVEGSRSARPKLPDLNAFDIVSGGQSTQVRIVNGKMTASVSHNYLLVPKQIGTFQIGEATVELEGRTYRSRAFKVRVLDPGDQPRQARDVFVTAQLSNETPYVGEQVIYTWRFYRHQRVQVAGANLEPQDFGGLLVEDLGELREFETTVGGQTFRVSEIKKALFPQEPGKIEVPGSSLTCQIVVRSRGRRRGSLFDDFFSRPQTATKVLRSESLIMEVRSRPAPPQGFTGLVGQFSIASEISKRDLQVGESSTLKVTVSGKGNAQMISPPIFPELSQFKIYEDQPKTSLNRRLDGLVGKKTFNRAIVPLEPGEITLPPISLTYFDPSRGSYRTVSTQPIGMVVAPGDGKEELQLTESLAPSTGKVSVRILADDILPVHTELAAVAPLVSWTKGSSLLVALLCPPLLFLLVLGMQRHRLRLASDHGFRRRRGALKRALAELGRVGEARDSGEIAERASRCVRTYIGDALNLEGAALTPSEAEQHLRSRGIDEQTVEKVHRLLERLEAARYASASGQADESAMTENIRRILRELDGRIS